MKFAALSMIAVFIVQAAMRSAQPDDPRVPAPARNIDSHYLGPIVVPEADIFGDPSNLVDKTDLLAWLAAGNFEALEAEWRRLRDSARRDVRYELQLFEALSAFSVISGIDVERLDEWVRTSPSSAAAHLSRSSHLLARAWRTRGHDWVYNVPPDSLARMQELAAEALADAMRAQELDADNVAAYVQELLVRRLDGWSMATQEVLARGLARFPDSYLVRSTAIGTAEPRWGGSYAVMARLADDAQAYVDRNPRLAALRGAVFAEQAREADLDGDLGGALELYGAAIRHGAEWSYLLGRGKTYFALRDGVRALVDLTRAAEQRPQHPEILRYRGATLSAIAGNFRAERLNALRAAEKDLELSYALEPDEWTLYMLDQVREQRLRAES